MLIFGSFFLGQEIMEKKQITPEIEGGIKAAMDEFLGFGSGRSGWTFVDVKKYSGLRYSTLCVLSGEVFLNDFFRHSQWDAYLKQTLVRR